MALVSDPTMPSGWRYQHEPIVTQFIDNGDGTLTPTISKTADGRPIATTPEQVAALMELELAEPPTMADRMRRWQIESALASADTTTADAELHAQYGIQARLDPRVDGSEIMTPPDEPATLAEQTERIDAARTLAGQLGYQLATEVKADHRTVNGLPDRHETLLVYLLNSNGSISYGPAALTAIEARLATDQKQREAERQRQRLQADYAQRQRAEEAARLAGSPAGQIAALQRQVAELTGQPAPASHTPSRVGVALVTVNDVPVGEVPI